MRDMGVDPAMISAVSTSGSSWCWRGRRGNPDLAVPLGYASGHTAPWSTKLNAVRAVPVSRSPTERRKVSSSQLTSP